MLLDSLSDVLEKRALCGSTTVWACAGVSIVPLDEGADGRHLFECRASRPGEKAIVAISRPLGDVAMFWKVGMRSGEPAMPADWGGKASVSLANSAPMGCLLDGADCNVLSFAYSFAEAEITMRYGVDEEHALFTVTLDIARMPEHSQLMLIDSRERVEVITRELSMWMGAGLTAFPVAEEATEPVFSTWYASLQNVSDRDLARQTEKIAELGCKSVFIDDGWQQFAHGRGYEGCGDWIPDAAKFPDMASTVKRFRQAGLSTVLWIAPLLLGKESEVFPRLACYAPIFNGNFGSNFYVLDPRRRVVRDYVAEVCNRLVNDYGIAGLKIDFLEQASVYQGLPLDNPEEEDVTDVGEAMHLMLEQVRSALVETCEQTPIVEFRQPYSSPAIAPYSNVVRASDCPADATTNRIRIVDERMVAVNRVVHGDMLLWDTAAGAQACAEQLLSSFFAVPQISVEPTAMAAEQFETCRFLLDLWKRYREVILRGTLRPVSVTGGYPLIHAYREDIQLSAVYAPGLIVTADTAEVTRIVVLNVSHEDSVTLRIRGMQSGLVRLSGTSRDCTGALLDMWHSEELHESSMRFNGTSPDGESYITIPCPHCGVLELTLDT